MCPGVTARSCTAVRTVRPLTPANPRPVLTVPRAPPVVVTSRVAVPAAGADPGAKSVTPAPPIHAGTTGGAQRRVAGGMTAAVLATLRVLRADCWLPAPPPRAVTAVVVHRMGREGSAVPAARASLGTGVSCGTAAAAATTHAATAAPASAPRAATCVAAGMATAAITARGRGRASVARVRTKGCASRRATTTCACAPSSTRARTARRGTPAGRPTAATACVGRAGDQTRSACRKDEATAACACLASRARTAAHPTSAAASRAATAGAARLPDLTPTAVNARRSTAAPRASRGHRAPATRV
eukprot:GHVL01004644.1.p2 GENE.GHVL01004644.1~~GHVL01004644.1.p2  ORF type:complete len:301 (+),score=12.17 GHVL01004644.1:333-1235(+)